MHKAVTYYPSFFLFLFSYFSIFYCKILFNPYKYYSYLPKELLWTKELLCSLVCYLFVRNVYAFFTLKKTLKRPFKAILKSFKLLLIFYRIHFTFSFFALHTLQSRMRKSYPHFHKPFKFAILRGCSSLFTYTVFLILLFLLHPSYIFNIVKSQKPETFPDNTDDLQTQSYFHINHLHKPL